MWLHCELETMILVHIYCTRHLFILKKKIEREKWIENFIFNEIVICADNFYEIIFGPHHFFTLVYAYTIL